MKLTLFILLALVMGMGWCSQFSTSYFQETSEEAEDLSELFDQLYDIEEEDYPVFVNEKQYPSNGQVEEYDLDMARMLAGFSQAAYCKVKKIEKWKCGKPCKEYPFMEDIIILKNGVIKDNHAFMGYYSANNIIVIIFKGTISIRNWLEDFDFIKVKYPYCEGCEVHKGFYNAYNSLQDAFWEGYQQLKEKYPTARLVVSGHSLGAALSTFCAGDLVEKGVTDFLWYNFGSPRCGNEDFSTWLQGAYEQRLYRVTHHKDPVPHLPPESFGFHHLAQEVFYVHKSAPEEEHMMCNLTGEDPNCSDQYLIDADVLDHLEYEGWSFLANIAKCLI